MGTAGEAPEHITLVDGPDDVDARRGPRPGQGRLAVPDHAVGRRDDGDGRRCASASRRCRTRRATTSATPPRTARWRSSRSPRESDLVIVVGSANSSNSVRLVEVALEHGAAAAHRVDYATEIDEAWLDGVTHGRGHQRRVRARDPGARRARAGSPSAATARRGGRDRPRRTCSSPSRTSCAATSRPPGRRRAAAHRADLVPLGQQLGRRSCGRGTASTSVRRRQVAVDRLRGPPSGGP